MFDELHTLECPNYEQQNKIRKKRSLLSCVVLGTGRGRDYTLLIDVLMVLLWCN